MPTHIFDLPIELLTLVLGQLELVDIFRFCSTCHGMRQTFTPQDLVWVVENYHQASSTLARSLTVGEQIRRMSYLLRCHTFLELFRVFGVQGDYDLLVKCGASFRAITCGPLLERYWQRFGPGAVVDFLLKHGFSLEIVQGGSNRLLEDALRLQNHEWVAFLIKHGASMQNLPSGPEQLLEDLLDSTFVPWTHVMSILTNSRPLLHIPRGLEEWLGRQARERLDVVIPYLPSGVNVMLKVLLCRYGLGPDVDTLLRRGASFHEISRSGDFGYDASGIVTAICTEHWDTFNEKGQTPLIRAVILGHVDAVTFLLENGADYELEWNHGSPLSHATTRGWIEVAQLLLEHGASIRGKVAPSDSGVEMMPLLCDAVQRRHSDMALLLLTHAADPDVTTLPGSTSLHLAAEQDHWEMIRMLLEHGACSRIADADGFYPLTLAAMHGCLASVKALATDYEVNLRDEGGRTALTAATAAGRMDIVQLLLDRGADPTFSAFGQTPLFAAAAAGHVEMVDLFLRLGADIDAAYEGKSPLYAAASQGHSSIVQRLISQGAFNDTKPLCTALENLHLAAVKALVGSSDLEIRDEKSRTPLLIAASVDFLNGMRLLIQKGAYANATVDGDNALHIAVNRGYIHTGMVICKHVAVDQVNASGDRPIHIAARNGSLDLVRAFVEHGLSIDSTEEEPTSISLDIKDQHGCTPLFVAAAKGHVHVVRYLVGKGAAVDDRDNDGRTPLIAAVEERYISVVEFLIEKGADVNAVDGAGWAALHFLGRDGGRELGALLIDRDAKQIPCSEGTPLHLAARLGNVSIATLFLEKGADGEVTHEGDTPLHLAIEYPETVRQLLRFVVVDSLDKHGKTPLMKAIQLDQRETVQILVEAGADANREYNDSTSFHLASQAGWINVVQAMRGHGADLCRRDRLGRTALHVAASEGQLDVAAYLVSEGADRWAQDDQGKLPWNHAFENDHIEVAVLVLPELELFDPPQEAVVGMDRPVVDDAMPISMITDPGINTLVDYDTYLAGSV